MKVSQARADAGSDPMRDDCPGRELFQLVTNRWTLLVLWALKDGELRFYQLRDSIEGISERMLSESLKALGAKGLLERRVEPSIPPKVSYSLTEPGRELLVVMEALTAWIARRVRFEMAG